MIDPVELRMMTTFAQVVFPTPGKIRGDSIYPKRPVASVVLVDGDRLVLGKYIVWSPSFNFSKFVSVTAGDRKREPWVGLFHGRWPVCGSVQTEHKGMTVTALAGISVEAILTPDEYRSLIASRLQQE